MASNSQDKSVMTVHLNYCVSSFLV